MKVVRAEQEQQCDNWWFIDGLLEDKLLFDDYDFSEQDKALIKTISDEKALIKKDELCLKITGEFEGEEYTSFVRPDVNYICYTYDVYYNSL